LHTDYHRAVLELLRPFVVHRDASWSSQAHELVVRASIASHRELRYLIYELDRQFPDVPLPFSTLNPLIAICHDTISHLRSDAANPEHAFYFCLCLRVLGRLSKAFTIAPLIAQGIFRVAQRQHIELPMEAEDLAPSLKDGPLEIPQLNKVNSSLPIDLGLVDGSTDMSRLQQLIGETGNLSLAG